MKFQIMVNDKDMGIIEANNFIDAENFYVSEFPDFNPKTDRLLIQEIVETPTSKLLGGNLYNCQVSVSRAMSNLFATFGPDAVLNSLHEAYDLQLLKRKKDKVG